MTMNIDALETALASGRYAVVDELAAEALQQAAGLEEKAHLWAIQIDARVARNRFSEALAAMAEAFRMLNITMSDPLNLDDTRKAYLRTKLLFADRRIESLAEMSPMDDIKDMAALRLLRSAVTAAYFGEPLRLPLLVCRAVSILMRHGNSPEAPYWYALYGMVLCLQAEDIDTGLRFGQLALDMAAQPPFQGLRTKTAYFVQGYILHWQMPLKAGLEPLRAGYHHGVKAGDREYAARCALLHSSHAFISGRKLDWVESIMAQNSTAIGELNQELPLKRHELYRQAVANLKAPTQVSHQLLGPFFNEQWELVAHRKAGNQAALGAAYLVKLQLSYLFGEYPDALENARFTRDYLEALCASAGRPLYHFYGALTRLALCPGLSALDRHRHLQVVEKDLALLLQWATRAPANYQHKYLLVDAEYQAVRGDDHLAAQRFDQAIDTALDNDFIQETALGCELAGRFYKALGRDRAAVGYLRDALTNYRRWGAEAKVRQMMAHYPELVEFNGKAAPGPLPAASRSRDTEDKLSHLATAIEQAVEAIAILDNQGMVTFVNPALEQIMDQPQDALLGRHVTAILEGSGNDGLFQEIRRKVSQRQVWAGPVHYRPSGRVDVRLEVTVSPVQDAARELTGFVMVARDVSYELQMEKELRQAQKMEAIGTLAGGIAHDFNNILLAISGYTELAVLEVKEQAETRRLLDNVLAASHRAKDLVHQILAFSRQAEQEMQPVALHHLIKEAMRLMRATLPTTIEIVQEQEFKNDIVLADPTKIHQLLMNLCTNAAHAMQQNGGILTIGLKSCSDEVWAESGPPDLGPGRYLLLEVADTGSGIPAEIQQRIFEPFFTTKQPGRGTGMGLAVSHGIVKSHRGAITVDSEPGKGSIFRVYLPLHEKSLAEIGRSPAMLGSDELPMPRGSERILLVDDEPALTELGEEMLQDLGYRVSPVNDSTQALQIFVENPQGFDLMITDQTMPRKTGLQLAEEMLALRPDMPIILTTGFSEGVSEENVEQMGIRALIMKPYTQQKLARIIRNILDA
ncbi:MAG: ATP-binding protein [Desulfobacterales bacterium]